MNAELHRASDRAASDGAETRSLAEDVRGLADDARAYIATEVTYQKARASHVAGLVPAIAIYGILAFLFVFFALGGLVVGMILALTPWLTAWGAMAAVCLTLVLGAGVCVYLAWGKWRAIAATFAAGADL